MQVRSAVRQKDVFRADPVVSLSGDTAVTENWVAHSRLLWRKAIELLRRCRDARALLKQALDDITHWNDLRRARPRPLADIEAAQRR